MMKPSQKALNDLIRSLDSADKAPAQARTSLYKADIEHFLGFLPLSLRDEIGLAFEEKRKADSEQAKVWLTATASIFLQDYDGSPLTREEWEQIRDLIADFSGELDMDLVSYVMGLVVENGAL
jgi:hypothetical protein